MTIPHAVDHVINDAPSCNMEYSKKHQTLIVVVDQKCFLMD